MNNTITISREDFRNICMSVQLETLKEKDLKGPAAFIIPVTGLIFARELESKLFDEKEEEKNE